MWTDVLLQIVPKSRVLQARLTESKVVAGALVTYAGSSFVPNGMTTCAVADTK